MYEVSFGLSRRPFPSLPHPAFYYPASTVEYARQTVLRCVDRGEGVAVVVGPTGCGKSLVGKMVAEHFRESMHVVWLASGRLDSRRTLLQAILYELGRPFRGLEEGELRLALTDYLSRSENPRPMLLLVDEAEALSMRLVDELRMTTNLSIGGEPCSRPVLLGGPVLEERLTHPKLESFTQRIAARCYLEAMNRTETRECIQAQLAAASATEMLFSDEACDAVYQATDGVPRLVNQLCDHALILAFAEGQSKIGRPAIEEAWADLQQLPTPWNEDRDDSSSANIIEFGGLAGDEGGLDDSQEAGAAEPSRVPALRITPEEDSEEDDLIRRSSDRLDGIEESLDQVSEDFKPAGSIGPEVELVFHDPADLLNEDFQEEEMVVDRYSPTRDETEPEAAGEAWLTSQGESSVEQDDERLAVAQGGSTQDEAGSPAAVSEGEGRSDARQVQEEPTECETEAEDESQERHTLEVHSERPIPKLKHKDFARLFSNLRRTAQ